MASWECNAFKATKMLTLCELLFQPTYSVFNSQKDVIVLWLSRLNCSNGTQRHLCGYRNARLLSELLSPPTSFFFFFILELLACWLLTHSGPLLVGVELVVRWWSYWGSKESTCTTLLQRSDVEVRRLT